MCAFNSVRLFHASPLLICSISLIPPHVSHSQFTAHPLNCYLGARLGQEAVEAGRCGVERMEFQRGEAGGREEHGAVYLGQWCFSGRFFSFSSQTPFRKQTIGENK